MLNEEEILHLTGGSSEWRLEPTGGGFQGAHYYLESGGRKWFVKAQPNTPGCDYYEKLGAFIKEPQVYSILLPEINHFVKTGVKVCPDIYVSRKGLMVMEDLTQSGWKLLEGNFNKNHIQVTLETLAYFHAASLNLGNRTPILKKFAHILKETYFGESPLHPGIQTWSSFVTTVRKIYSLYFPDQSPIEATSLMMTAPKMVKPSTKYRNCVCHGDLWKNNIFFKYSNGEPVAACFVDFAQVRFCPPALDVLMFLKQLQVDHMMTYVVHYHACLQRLVPDFSFAEFYDSFKVALPFALCISPLYIYLTKLPENVLNEITRTQEAFLSFAKGEDAPAMEALKEDQVYRHTLLNALEELLEYSRTKTAVLN